MNDNWDEIYRKQMESGPDLPEWVGKILVKIIMLLKILTAIAFPIAFSVWLYIQLKKL